MFKPQGRPVRRTQWATSEDQIGFLDEPSDVFRDVLSNVGFWEEFRNLTAAIRPPLDYAGARMWSKREETCRSGSLNGFSIVCQALLQVVYTGRRL